MAKGNIILNETIKILNESVKEWLQWVDDNYLSHYLDSGLVKSFQINRIINNEEDGTTFAIQLNLESMAHVHKLHSEYLKKAQQSLESKFKNKYVIFRTLMEIEKSSEK